MDDNLFFSLVGITEQVYDFFTVKEGKREDFVHQDFDRFGFYIELDPDLYKINRSIFNFWNVLESLGGLYGIFYAICSIVCQLFNMNKAEDRWIKYLYNNYY